MSIREPDKFRLIYNCKIKDTGQKIYKVPNVAYPLQPLLQPMDPKQVIEHESEPIIAIEMPHSEYEKFRDQWDLHMNIIKEARDNPIFREEYERLLMLLHLYR